PLLLDHAADDLGSDVLQRHRAHDRSAADLRPGVPAVLSRYRNRGAGCVAVLRDLPVPTGVPAVQLRLLRGHGLVAVPDHHDHLARAGEARQPVRLLRERALMSIDTSALAPTISSAGKERPVIVKPRRSIGSILGQVIHWIVLVFFAALFLYPFAW